MIAVPNKVWYLLTRLEQNGYEGYLVGGCVRDALLGITPKDWDLCTSAQPAEIAACFPGEKPSLSGFRHGTVGVVLDGRLYEITSYRTERNYSDGRHPDLVTFVRDLKEDLSRRDFTVNAMAYHPDKGLVDPWNGQEDLTQRVLRCVGSPVLRFQEDSLRILRGMRFAATYGFQLEKDTARAAIFCRKGLEQISKERIREELFHFLVGAGAGKVLSSFWQIFAKILPECGEKAAEWEKLADRIDRASEDLIVRLAILCSDPVRAQAMISRLQLSRKMADEVQTLLQWKEDPSLPLQTSMKYLLRDTGRQTARRWIDYQFALENEEGRRQRRAVILAQILETGECFSVRQLAIDGKDLKELGFSGSQLGACLSYLLDQVIMGKTENTLSALRDAARCQRERQDG